MNKNTLYWLLGIFAGFGLVYWRREDVEQIGTEIMTKLSRSQFISKYGPIATQATKGTGLFPSVTIAQAILESGDGNSSLTKEAKNFFGIKADSSWVGPYVTKLTTEYINGAPVKVEAKFRAYESALESFQDRVKFLRKFSRYKNVFTATSPEQQAQALQNAGYATDPNYASLLTGLINKNNLKQFDTL